MILEDQNINLKRNYKLIILYILLFLVLYPILRYLVIFQILEINHINDRFIAPPILISGPGLIILGGAIMINSKSIMNKIVGLISILTGAIWLIFIIITILEEAG